MSETKMSMLPFMFKWVSASASPDPHNKTMRNSLEPDDILVQVDIPLKAIFIANAEPIIQFQLGTDNSIKKMPKPILTPEGLAEVHKRLSSAAPKEEASEDEWDETSEETTTDDEKWSDDDDDDTWEDE